MNLAQCPDCSNMCSVLASVCPKCGRPFQPGDLVASARTRTKPSEILAGQKSTPAKKLSAGKSMFTAAVAGLLGVVVGSSLVVIGGLLSFSGIGACFGIPLVIIGIGLPFGAVGVFGAIQGPCPYCGTSLSALRREKGVKCSACTKRVVVRDMRFFAVD